MSRQDSEQRASFGRDVQDATAVLHRGQLPDGIDALTASARGTEWQGKLQNAILTREQIAEFKRRPLAEQARTMIFTDDDARALAADPDFIRLMPNVYAETLRKFKQGDGIAHAAETGIINPPVEIDFTDPASLRARVTQAQVASRHYGATVEPLDSTETEQLMTRIDTALPDQAAALVATVSQGLGRDGALATAARIARDRPVTAVAMVTAGDDKKLSREMVVGDRRLRDNPDMALSEQMRTDTVAEVAEMAGGCSTSC